MRNRLIPDRSVVYAKLSSISSRRPMSSSKDDGETDAAAAAISASSSVTSRQVFPIVRVTPNVTAPVPVDAEAYDPPPFDSFGRSVTVTVVVHENNCCATFVAEHATVVVPIRN